MRKQRASDSGVGAFACNESAQSLRGTERTVVLAALWRRCIIVAAVVVVVVVGVVVVVARRWTSGAGSAHRRTIALGTRATAT
jgi:hypothetical protein